MVFLQEAAAVVAAVAQVSIRRASFIKQILHFLIAGGKRKFDDVTAEEMMIVGLMEANEDYKAALDKFQVRAFIARFHSFIEIFYVCSQCATCRIKTARAVMIPCGHLICHACYKQGHCAYCGGDASCILFKK